MSSPFLYLKRVSAQHSKNSILCLYHKRGAVHMLLDLLSYDPSIIASRDRPRYYPSTYFYTFYPFRWYR